MEDSIRISIPSDSEGFLARKCQACSKLFKIHLDQSGKALAHCPYCNAEGDDWLTDAQREYAQAVGFNYLQDSVGKELEEMARNFNRGMPRGGFITAKMTHTPSPKRPVPPAPVEPESSLFLFTFECCDESIKYDGAEGPLFCIICGQQASTA